MHVRAEPMAYFVITEGLRERDIARTNLSYMRPRLSKARRKCQSHHRFRHNRDPFAAALYQAAKASRKIERSLSSSARVAVHHGLRIDPLTHTHKDFS